MRSEKSNQQSLLYPPCQANCPVNTDARGYVNAIGRADYQSAYELITEKNYFPSVCGRICPHPCEDECRRSTVEEAISIARLKRFAADEINRNKQFAGDPIEKESGKKVAIIGSGPSGLTCAAEMRKAGHSVIIYEKEEKPGGMLAYGVPNFRLDFPDINEDVARILNLGIELKTKIEVGKDINFDDLVNKHDAVIISAGLSISRSLPIEGVNNKNVLKAISFLNAANSGKSLKVGSKVVVVGGGDVAMDVARTALRGGAKEVEVYCLECSEEMPAHQWEVEEAIEEGINIFPSYGPKAFKVQKEKVIQVEFVGVKSIFDDEGRFNPQYKERDKKKTKADTVILAIGQASNLAFLKDSDVKLNDRGQLIADKKTLVTSNPKVFGCGEVAKGPGAAIDAIAHAHKVAQSVNRYLENKELGFEAKKREKLEELPKDEALMIKEEKRAQPKMREANERINDFEIFEDTFNKKEATREAHRCLNCTAGAFVDEDKCVACLTCVRVCPYEVPEFKENVAYVDALECQACGFCAADCPAEAIRMNVLPLEEIDKKIEVNAKGKEILIIGCEYGFKGKDIEIPDKSSYFMVPCAGRIDVINLINSFSNGVKNVVIHCADKECRHKDGVDFIERRAAYVNEKLMVLGQKEKSVVVINEDKETLSLKDIEDMIPKGEKA